MRRIIRINFTNFSRRKQRQIDPQQMEAIQYSKILKCEKKKYKYPNFFKHQDILYEQELYGNKCQISGITQNNIKSAQFTNQVIQSSKPKLIILGGLNDTEAMIDLEQPIQKFLNIENLTAAKLYCKSSLLPVLQKKIQQDTNYFYQIKKKKLWRMNHFNRTLQINDYYNAAYESMFKDYKIIYGKPSSVIIYEDLILRIELNELKNIFQRTIKKVIQNNQNNCQHTSSIIMETVKFFAMNQQPVLYSKQISYTTSLLNRLTKIDSRNLLLINNCFVKKISQQIHNMDFQPQSVYRKWLNDTNSENYHLLNYMIYQNKIQQILQKFAILSILKGFHLQVYLHCGKNFFNHSIFNNLFYNLSCEDILTLYKPIKAKYMQKIYNIQRIRIKNKITYSEPLTQYMYLNDQFKTIQKRKQMFLYEFQPKNYITQKQQSQKIIKLKQKINQIVQLQCDEYQKRLLQQYNKGNFSKQSIILYSKLVGKANVELKQKVKLPYFHFNAFRGFYKQYYREHLLFDQDKKKHRLQMKRLHKLQQKFDKITKQIKDPQSLRKILLGQKGQVKQLNIYQDQQGQIDFDGELQDIKKVIQQLGGNQQMINEINQFRKNNPSEKQQFDDDQVQFPENLEDYDQEMQIDIQQSNTDKQSYKNKKKMKQK